MDSMLYAEGQRLLSGRIAAQRNADIFKPLPAPSKDPPITSESAAEPGEETRLFKNAFMACSCPARSSSPCQRKLTFGGCMKAKQLLFI